MEDIDSDVKNRTRNRSSKASLYTVQKFKRQGTSSFERAFGFLSKVPWEKISIWAIFLFLFWTLRDFFTLILLTFVFTYIANTLVRFLSNRLRVDRRSLTVLLFIAFLGLFLGPGQWFANRVIEQGRPLAREAAGFIQELSKDDVPENGSSSTTPSSGDEETSDQDQQAERFPEEGGKKKRESTSSDAGQPNSQPSSTETSDENKRTTPETTGKADASPQNLQWKIRELQYRIESLNRKINNLQSPESNQSGGTRGTHRAEKRLQQVREVPEQIRDFVNDIIRQNLGSDWLAWIQNRGLYDNFLVEIHQLWKSSIPYITQFTNVVLVNVGNFLFTFLLALLFSFLIVFDIPRLQERLSQFEKGRLRDFYREIAPSLANFGTIMGRTLQAQAMIAVVNTVLTIAGIYIMSLLTGIDFTPYLAVLTIIVFVCSFVPVLGVIISTIPIGLIALTKGGIWPLIAVVILIMVIHGIEAYILNPNIYGVHLRMHPLLVLIVLLVAEHFFGLWGLVLGVPVSVYLLDIVIQQATPEELFYQPEN